MTKYLTPTKIYLDEEIENAKGHDKKQLLLDIQFQLKEDTGYKLPLGVLYVFMKTYTGILGDLVASGYYVNLGEELPYIKTRMCYMENDKAIDWQKSYKRKAELIEQGLYDPTKPKDQNPKWVVFRNYVGKYYYIALVHRSIPFAAFTRCYTFYKKYTKDARNNPKSMYAKFRKQININKLVFA